MRVARERLTFLALCVVDEASARAEAGAVPASPGLRLALAHLHLCGAERHWIDQIWRALVQRSETGGGSDAFGRRQEVTAAMNAIYRQVGIEVTLELEDALTAARRHCDVQLRAPRP